MKQDKPTCVGDLGVLDKAVIFFSKRNWVPCGSYPRNHPSPCDHHVRRPSSLAESHGCSPNEN